MLVSQEFHQTNSTFPRLLGGFQVNPDAVLERRNDPAISNNAVAAEFIQEITTFPASKYDDQADSISQVLAWIDQNELEPAAFTWMKIETAIKWSRQGVQTETIAAQLDASLD